MSKMINVPWSYLSDFTLHIAENVYSKNSVLAEENSIQDAFEVSFDRDQSLNRHQSIRNEYLKVDRGVLISDKNIFRF